MICMYIDCIPFSSGAFANEGIMLSTIKLSIFQLLYHYTWTTHFPSIRLIFTATYSSLQLQISLDIDMCHYLLLAVSQEVGSCCCSLYYTSMKYISIEYLFSLNRKKNSSKMFIQDVYKPLRLKVRYQFSFSNLIISLRFPLKLKLPIFIYRR